MQHRPDIDGLRALAVMSVICFHFQITGFNGGYIGVDVFFVISGFLITRKILSDIHMSGKLDLSAFFLGRVRRLFPALCTTVAATMFAGALFMSPLHLERLGMEAATALTSTSNFFFWSQNEYFDAGKHFSALMHTWSLSVEYQFYLIWPFLLAGCMVGRQSPPAILVVISIASLVSAQAVDDRAAGFFLTPFRIFEFAIGASLVWLPKSPRQGVALESALFLGLAMIAFAILFFTGETRFPGLSTLLPTTGAMVVIYAGRARYLGLLLRNPLSTWLGRISYSLYLVHWPLLIFNQYRISDPAVPFGPLPTSELVTVLTASIGLGALLHYSVEEPLRRPRTPRASSDFVVGCAVGCLLLVGVSLDQSQNGWRWRLDPEVGVLLESPNRIVKPLGECQYMRASLVEIGSMFPNCTKYHGKAVLVIGDSHAEDLFNALIANASRRHIVGITQPGCRPYDIDECAYSNTADFVRDNLHNVEAVIFTQKGSYFLTESIRLPVLNDRISFVQVFLMNIAEAGVPVVWVGPQWEPQFRVDRAIARTSLLPPGTDFMARSIAEIADVDAAISSKLGESGKTQPRYVSKVGLLGPLSNEKFVVDGEFTYADGNHWSAKGEEVFGARLIQQSPILLNLLGFKGERHDWGTVSTSLEGAAR